MASECCGDPHMQTPPPTTVHNTELVPSKSHHKNVSVKVRPPSLLLFFRVYGTQWTSQQNSACISCVYFLQMPITLSGTIQRVSKRMTRFQILTSNNENVLQLQNKLQTIK